MKMRAGEIRPTTASSKETKVKTIFHSEAKSGHNAEPLTLIDIPGHPRIRETSIKNNALDIGCIVFVIDAVHFPNEARFVADYIYDILSLRFVHNLQLPILFACNKMDISMASSIANIQQTLESEMYVTFSFSYLSK